MREGAGSAWAAEAGAEACEQQGRDGSPALEARVTRGAAGSCIAQKRRNGASVGGPVDQCSPHMGKFTKVNTLNSVMMEKHRNTPYRKRHPHPSFLSSCHLFR